MYHMLMMHLAQPLVMCDPLQGDSFARRTFAETPREHMLWLPAPSLVARFIFIQAGISDLTNWCGSGKHSFGGAEALLPAVQLRALPTIHLTGLTGIKNSQTILSSLLLQMRAKLTFISSLLGINPLARD